MYIILRVGTYSKLKNAKVPTYLHLIIRQGSTVHLFLPKVNIVRAFWRGQSPRNGEKGNLIQWFRYMLFLTLGTSRIKQFFSKITI